MGYFESDALEMLEVYLLETRQLNGQAVRDTFRG